MSIESHIQQLNADIKALEADVKTLSHEHDQIYREVALFESENKYKNLSKPKFSPPPAVHDEDAPALIHYSFFDPSISKYFSEAPEEKIPQTERVLETISLKTTAGHVALCESIMRFGGITAFPINLRLYDTEEDALLGLRFDVLSPEKRNYVTPHYIILRRYRVSQKDGIETVPWRVFRYTTPTYVPLDTYLKHLENKDEPLGLQRFAEAVRLRLVHVQWKHNVFDRLLAITKGEILKSSLKDCLVTVSRDLQCQRIELALLSSCKVQLVCSDLHVDTVTCGIGGETGLTVQAMLSGISLEEFPAQFCRVALYLNDKGLLES